MGAFLKFSQITSFAANGFCISAFRVLVEISNHSLLKILTFGPLSCQRFTDGAKLSSTERMSMYRLSLWTSLSMRLRK